MSIFNLFNKKEDTLKGFNSTNNTLGKKLKFITENYTHSSSDFIEQLMVTLIEADIGYETADKICKKVYKKCSDDMRLTADKLLNEVSNTFKDIYGEDDTSIVFNDSGPTVILMVGVNGSGKTTTIGKLAKKFIDNNKSVCLIAGDTFRAGASEQLKEIANKLNIECIIGKENQDPSSLFMDGLKEAVSKNIDIVIADSAGRLQNKVNLMNELAKMNKVMAKVIADAPHNTFLVIDANTGQNGISQAELFSSVCKLNGIILTKLDGTSKGGIILAIKNLTGVPVKFVCFGEDLDSLQVFNLDEYITSIVGELKHVN